MKKKVLAVVLTVALMATLFSACKNTSNKAAETSNKTSTPVELTYYTIGTPPADVGKVSAAISEMTKEKINVTVNIKFIDWGDYTSKMSAIINSGGDFDLCFMSGQDYLTNSKKGAFIALDDYLNKDAKGIMDAVTPGFWDGVKIDGKIYGVPTNKEIATPNWYMYPKELVDKYNIKIDTIKNLSDLEPYLKTIKEKEPSWQPMMFDQDSHFEKGYEYIIGDKVPVVVKQTDNSLKAVNLYDEQATKDTLNTLRKYYQAGYINQDAAVKPPSGLVKGEKVFWKAASGGPYSDVVWSIDKGYTVVASQVEDSYISTDSTRGALVCVSSNSKHKDEAVRLLNLINTDSKVRNTLNYGIENTHWKLTADKKVQYIDPAHDSYKVPGYSLGNWFILYPTENDPADKWDVFKKFNNAAKKSSVLGFTPNTDEIKNEIAAITNVTKQHRPALMTGSVDIDENLKKYNQEMKAAGIDKVITTLQKQLDEFKKSAK